MDIRVSLHSAKFQLYLVRGDATSALNYGQLYSPFIDCSQLYLPETNREIDGTRYASCLSLWSHAFRNAKENHDTQKKAKQLLSIISERGGASREIFGLVTEEGDGFFDDIPLGSFRTILQHVPPNVIDWNACSYRRFPILCSLLQGYDDVDPNDVDSDARKRFRETLAEWDVECRKVLEKMYLAATTSDAEDQRFEQALNWNNSRGCCIIGLAVKHGHVKTLEAMLGYHPRFDFDYQMLQTVRKKGCFYSQNIPEESACRETVDALLYAAELHHQKYLKAVSQSLHHRFISDLANIVGVYFGVKDVLTSVGSKRKRQDE